MSDEIEMRMATEGQRQEIIDLMNLIQAAVTLSLNGREPTPEHLSYAMTAASMFAGSLFGGLIIAGLAKDQDKRRTVDIMGRNFRAGIDIGKQHTMRAATEQFGGNA